MNKITFLLVDDHKLIRESLAFILNSDPRFQVIAETSSGSDAVEIAMDLRPHIILMDINMNPVNGFEATKLIRIISPGSKIIGISMNSMPCYAKRLLQVGAMGYVTKNSSRDEMIMAIMEVYQGNIYICDEVKKILVHQHMEKVEAGQPDINALSMREIQIAKHIRNGSSSKEIASDLQISVKTVEVHRYNILKKLTLKNSASLINFINHHGI